MKKGRTEKRKRAYYDDVVVAPGDVVSAGEEIRDGVEELPDLSFHCSLRSTTPKEDSVGRVREGDK